MCILIVCICKYKDEKIPDQRLFNHPVFLGKDPWSFKQMCFVSFSGLKWFWTAVGPHPRLISCILCSGSWSTRGRYGSLDHKPEWWDQVIRGDPALGRLGRKRWSLLGPRLSDFLCVSRLSNDTRKSLHSAFRYQILSLELYHVLAHFPDNRWVWLLSSPLSRWGNWG